MRLGGWIYMIAEVRFIGHALQQPPVRQILCRLMAPCIEYAYIEHFYGFNIGLRRALVKNVLTHYQDIKKRHS